MSKRPPGTVPGKGKHLWRSSRIGVGLLIDRDNTLSVEGVFLLRVHVSIAMWFSGDGGNIRVGIFVGPCQLLLNWPTLIVLPGAFSSAVHRASLDKISGPRQWGKRHRSRRCATRGEVGHPPAGASKAMERCKP
jgi:hypothetical protein